MKASEFEMCQKNGVKEITEVVIGYDGIVIANSVEGEKIDLSKRDIFLALGKEVPDPKGGEKLVPNPYKKWSEVNPELPDTEIEVLGPLPTSGTRDAFNELAIEGGCKTFDWIAAIKEEDKSKYKSICRSIREDGAYVEAGENDNLIVQKLAPTRKRWACSATPSWNRTVARCRPPPSKALSRKWKPSPAAITRYPAPCSST